MVVVRVRTSPNKSNKTMTNRPLKLGGNVFHRLCRPAWTGENSTGMWNSHKHRHGKDLEVNFFVRSGGIYRLPDRKLLTPRRNRGRTK
jgi:hypothetical protein